MKTQTNKFILPHSNGFSPSLSEHWTIVFIQLSSVHSDWEKNHWNVDICKTTTSRCFQNNAHPKETMLSPAQPGSSNRIAVFKNLNHKPICDISKVCVNLIPKIENITIFQDCDIFNSQF